MPYVAADSFTTAARVEALAGRGTHTVATTPTAQEVLDRMAQQGARVTAILARFGHGGTPPSGTSPLALTGPDVTLARLCDECNAYMAAAEVLQMHDVRDTNRDVYDAMTRMAEGETEFGSQIGGLMAEIEAYLRSSYPALSGAAVNENIEIETADLLHVTTMRF